ncbi:hypothetical protein FACS1894205_3180 [Alphaproteobacteria bacterium]|nr:hypothetical protein FACS1894205_3180 [Alphaproteobacteria bacterium]
MTTIRTNPDEMTPAEAAEWNEKGAEDFVSERFADVIEEMRREQEQAELDELGGERVGPVTAREMIYDDLVGLANLYPTVAKVYAHFMAKAFEVDAARKGVDPLELYRTSTLEFGRVDEKGNLIEPEIPVETTETVVPPDPIERETPSPKPIPPGEISAEQRAQHREEERYRALVSSMRKALAPDKSSRFPVIALLKKMGGVRMDSPLAAELLARDITPKRFPGLFKKDRGLRSFGNIPFSEHPLFRANYQEPADGYIDQEMLFDALEEEIKGNPKRTEEEQEADAGRESAASWADRLAEFGIQYNEGSVSEVAARMRKAAQEMRKENAEARLFEEKEAAERAVRVRAIQNMPAQEVTPGDPLDKKAAKDLVRGFSKMENKRDHRVVELPVGTVGKILRHQGFDVSTILLDLPGLYEGAIYGWNEDDNPQEGHKPHNNIAAYHNYINKFSAPDGKEYYVRFTLKEMKAKPGKTGNNLIHSTAISDVTINEDAGTQQSDPGSSLVLGGRPALRDAKLQDFFNSVKPSGIKETIDVDGVARPTTNSAGRPIHATEQGVRNFWKWFGDSKVVDEQGRPVVVYHNTDEERTVFDRERVRRSMEIQAHFFAPEIDPHSEYGPVRNDVYLRIINPADSNTAYDGFNPGRTDNEGVKQREKLQGQGYDGGIIFEDGKVSEYFVFDSNQIKSVNNSGAFDPNDSRILLETGPNDQYRGWFEQETDPFTGEMINRITLTPDMDLSTVLHEFGHFRLFQYIDYAFQADKGQAFFRSELKTILSDLGVVGPDGAAFDLDRALSAEEVKRAITREQHEAFAEKFEDYLMTGKAPSAELASVFARFKAWLMSIYHGFRHQLSPEIVGVFDRMMATDEEIAAQEKANGYPLSDFIKGLLTPEQAAELQGLADRATAQAENEVFQQALDEMRKQQTQQFRDEHKRLTAETREIIMQNPVSLSKTLCSGVI